MLKRTLLGGLALLCFALAGHVSAQTAASYKNSNGSFSNSVVQLCSTDGVNTVQCTATTNTIQGRGAATPTQTSVSVAANTSTLLIAANSTRRGLAIIPGAANTTCTINQAGGAATATSMPIPGGWNWTELDPPPATAVYAYCTTAGILSVTEMN